jgi:hypothetical protein
MVKKTALRFMVCGLPEKACMGFFCVVLKKVLNNVLIKEYP